MNFGLKLCVLALGVLSFDTANGQMCTKDHDVLSHNTELEVNVGCNRGDPDAYFNLKFGANPDSPYNNIHVDGWCIDVDRNVLCDDFLRVDTYSSYDDSIRSDAIQNPENLDVLNWLINNHHIGGPINTGDANCGVDAGDLIEWPEYQEAVWRIIDDSVIDLNATDCVVDWLVREAITKGNNFEFDCRNPDAKIGVVLIADSETTGEITNTVIMAEIPLKDVSGVCDCGSTTLRRRSDNSDTLGTPGPCSLWNPFC